MTSGHFDTLAGSGVNAWLLSSYAAPLLRAVIEYRPFQTLIRSCNISSSPSQSSGLSYIKCSSHTLPLPSVLNTGFAAVFSYGCEVLLTLSIKHTGVAAVHRLFDKHQCSCCLCGCVVLRMLATVHAANVHRLLYKHWLCGCFVVWRDSCMTEYRKFFCIGNTVSSSVLSVKQGYVR